MSRPTARLFRVRTIAVAATVALGLSLSACSTGTGSPGVAAYVGDTEVSEIAVTSTIKDWQLLTGEEISRADMVLALSQAHIVVPVGEEADLVDPEDVDQVIAELSEASGSDVTHVSQPTRELISYFVVMQNLQMIGGESAYAGVLEAIADTNVQLNPRYGTIEDGSFVPAGPLADAFTSEAVLDIFG